MRIWEGAPQSVPYSFDEVVSVFWNRYPNSKAPHILSEDVLERKIDGDRILTKKLIVKQGSSFLKAAPKWVSKLTNVQVVPTVEESIFDRSTQKLTTYTRNVSWTSIFKMHERCVYTPSEVTRQSASFLKTLVSRAVFVDVTYSAFDPLIERVFLLSFRNSIKKTAAGLMEKLEERFGLPASGVALSGGKISQKAASIKEKLLNNRKIGFEKA